MLEALYICDVIPKNVLCYVADGGYEGKFKLEVGSALRAGIPFSHFPPSPNSP
jgi:hypothetical protein